MRADYPDLRIELLQNDAVFITESIDGVIESLLIGSFLAFAVLFLFLREWRSPIVMGISIPLSIAVALFALYLSGITLNIMSLGGLALGTGLLVDNSIVVLEAIHKRRERETGRWRPPSRAPPRSAGRSSRARSPRSWSSSPWSISKA